MSLATGRPDVKFRSLRGATDYEVFVAKFPLRLVPKLWGFCRESPPFGPVRGASEPSDPPIRYLSRNYFPLFLNGLPDRRRAVRSFWPSFATNTSQRPLRGAIRLLGFRRIPERSPTFATNTL